MVSIVTTKSEVKTICHSYGVTDLRSILGNVKVIVADNIKALQQISPLDIVLTRTKKKWLVDALRGISCKHVIGENSIAYSYDINKEKLKELLRKHSVSTPKSYSLETLPGEPFDVFVKPLSLGDSIGIDEKSRCHTVKEVIAKLSSIKHYGESIIEDYIQGYDVTVGVVRQDGGYLSSGIEIIAPNGILDNEVKINNRERYRGKEDMLIEDLAVKVFKITGGNGYARIDIRIREDGMPFVLEINFCPGLSRDGYMYNAFRTKGYTYVDFVKMIMNT